MPQRAPYEALAQEGLAALGGVDDYVARCGLEKTVVDLVSLRVSQLNGCAYGVDTHASALLRECVSAEQLMLVSIWREAGPYFGERERAALAWAEVVTRIAKTHAPDADYEAAVAAFGEKAVADLTIAIGLLNLYDRLAISFRRPPAALAGLEAMA